MVEKTTFGNVKNILIAQDSFHVSLPVRVSGTANAVLKAGQPIAGDIKDRDTAFTVASTEAQGILLHDVKLDSKGNGNGTIVLAGCIDSLKLDSAVVSALEAVTTGLDHIIIVEGSRI